MNHAVDLLHALKDEPRRNRNRFIAILVLTTLAALAEHFL